MEIFTYSIMRGPTLLLGPRDDILILRVHQLIVLTTLKFSKDYQHAQCFILDNIITYVIIDTWVGSKMTGKYDDFAHDLTIR